MYRSVLSTSSSNSPAQSLKPAAPIVPSRRQLLRLLVGGAGAGLLAGCGSSVGLSALTDSGADVVDPGDFRGARLSAIMRRSFVAGSNELTESQVEEWSSATNASIELRLLDDWRDVYAEVAARRQGGDLAELFGTAVHIHANGLVDVGDLAEELGAAQGGWIDAARQAAMVDGVWRGIPWMYTANAINYREDFLAAASAGQIDTYDDLLEAATRLADLGGPLAAFSMSPEAPNDSANFAYSILWAFGGYEVDKADGRVALDSSETRAALSFFRQLALVSDQRAFTFDEGANNAAFLAGSIAMTQNASSIYWRAQNEVPEVAAAMNHVAYPLGPAGRPQLVEINTMGVFDHSRNVDAARDWIRFMLQPDQMRDRAVAALGFFAPSLLDYVEDAAMPWNADPKLAGMKGIHADGRLPGWPGPPTIEAGLAYNNGTVVRMFQSVGVGETSVGTAIRIATEELRRVYET